MKQPKIILLLIILVFNAHSEEHKKKHQRRELMYQYLLLAAGGLLTGYFTTKYVANSNEMSKVLTWQNDSEWEDRFFNLYQNKGITLQYIRIIIDNFASTMLNECIKAFKIKKEQAEQNESFIEANNQVIELTQYLADNYDEFQNEENVEIQQKFQKLQEFHKIIDKIQIKFEKQSQYCLNLYHFQTKHSFLSKYMLDLRYTMTYFKILNSGRDFEQFLTSEEKELPEDQKQELLIKEENIFKDFLKEVSSLIDHNDNWQKINQQFVTTYYTIHNIFTKQGERSIELRRK